MDKINSDGFKFSELNSENLLSRVAELEQIHQTQVERVKAIDIVSADAIDKNRPAILWAILHKYLGDNYFLDVI